MAFTLTRGTKEILPVDVDDSTDQVTTIVGATAVQFDVKMADSPFTAFYTNQGASATGMRISCLVDTSAAHPSGLWPEGHYELYVEFTIATENVRLGPIDVYIVGQG
jgi:hypothetical protein